MKEYKYVSIPEVVVTRTEKIDESVNGYFEIINQESVDGWEFLQIAQISLMKKRGAFRNTTERRNVFIFTKDKQED